MRGTHIGLPGTLYHLRLLCLWLKVNQTYLRNPCNLKLIFDYTVVPIKNTVNPPENKTLAV